MSLFAIAAIAGTLVLALVVANVLIDNKRNENWSVVAQRLQLRFQRDSLQGTVDGINLVVWNEVRRMGNNRIDYTLFRVHAKGAMPDGLYIEREGVLQKVKKAVGGEDVQLGIPALDKKLIIKATDEDAVREWAHRSAVSEGLAALTKLDEGRYTLSRGQLTFEVSHGVQDGDRVERIIRQLVSIAHALSGPEPAIAAAPQRPAVEPIEMPESNEPW